MDNNVIGIRIRQLREEDDLTQEEFGKKFNLTKKTISAYETGVIKYPPSETLKKIADHYHVSLDWIYGRTDQRFVYPLSAHYDGDMSEENINIDEVLEERFKDFLAWRKRMGKNKDGQ